MFTGIVEERGTVAAIRRGTDSAALTVRGPLVCGDATHGASIAVNGVCLTVVSHDGEQFTVDVMAETLARTTLGNLSVGDEVNLERAMAADGRFGGHVVQGHVDGTATLEARTPGDKWEVLTFALPPELRRHVVEKGSVTLDGVSLTVSAVTDTTFQVSLIPTTLRLTTLGAAPVGSRVNLEVDVLAKYVAQWQATPAGVPHPASLGTPPALSEIPQALDALAAGLPVLVLDDDDREAEGDVVCAADTLTPEWMAWTIRYTSGYVCAPMPAERADALRLPPMVADNQDPRRTAYTVTVDAASGVTTGISAADRTTTLRALARPDATPDDLIRPGHVVPLRARPGGVLERPGHTEAAVDLCRLAGLTPVAAIAELTHDDGTMMRTDDVLRLGAAHGLPVVTVAQLIAWRTRHDRVRRGATTRLPTRHGEFTAVAFRDALTGVDHVALLHDGPHQRVRVHSECLTGDVFGSARCDCGNQLQAAMEAVATGGGAIIYLRDHEGRGVGLGAKLAAYRLQDGGADTVDAQLQLGLPVDARSYDVAVAILSDLGIAHPTLLTNNPAKVEALRDAGLDVTVQGHETPPTADNLGYLQTKRDRMGHRLGLGEMAEVRR